MTPTMRKADINGRRGGSCLAATVAAVAFQAALPGNAHAQGGENAAPVFEPYVMVGAAYDSNLLRVDSEADPVLAGRDMDDRYFTVEAGLLSRFNQSLQTFLIDARIFQNLYDQFDEVDYTGGNARLEWQWRVGRAWYGDVGYLFRRSLRSFANQTFPRPDVRQESGVFASVNREIGTSMTLGIRGSSAEITYEEDIFLDLIRNMVAVSLEYETPRDSVIGIEATFTDGDFLNTNLRNFEQYTVQSLIRWQLTPRSAFNFNVGYTERQQTSEIRIRPDFGGPTGRISYVRDVQQGLSWEAAIYREISTLGDEVANYAVVDGVSIEPVWQLSRKTALRGVARFEQRDFKGLRNILNPGPELVARDDEVATGELWLDWDSERIIAVSLGVVLEDRSSTRPIEEYDFYNVQLQLRANF